MLDVRSVLNFKHLDVYFMLRIIKSTIFALIAVLMLICVEVTQPNLNSYQLLLF